VLPPRIAEPIEAIDLNHPGMNGEVAATVVIAISQPLFLANQDMI